MVTLRLRSAVLGAGVLALLCAYPFVVPGAYLKQVAILVLLYGALGSAWNVVGGFVGRISLGHAAFFGMGAYATIVLFVSYHVTPWLGMAVGALAAAALALLVGWPTLRLKGHYFAMATIALGEVVRIVFNDWGFVGAASGLETPIRVSWATLTFRSQTPYYFIALGLALITGIVVTFYVRGKAGHYWQAIRGDEDAAAALGVPTARYKMVGLVVSAALTGLWGGFFAVHVGFINPNSVFDILISVQMVLVAVLGGVGTLAGPWIGALVLLPLGELARVAFGGSGHGVDLLLYALVIVLITVLQPGGLLALRRRDGSTRRT